MYLTYLICKMIHIIDSILSISYVGPCPSSADPEFADSDPGSDPNPDPERPLYYMYRDLYMNEAVVKNQTFA